MIARARKRKNETLARMVAMREEAADAVAEHEDAANEASEELERALAALNRQIDALKRIRTEIAEGDAKRARSDVERVLDELDSCWRAA